MIILGIIGFGMAGWGMKSLNQQFPAAVSDEIDVLQVRHSVRLLCWQ